MSITSDNLRGILKNKDLNFSVLESHEAYKGEPKINSIPKKTFS